MERHIQKAQIPTFFIFSDVQEGKHRPEDLERLIPPHVLYSALVQILQIQPVTKAKMKKCLQSIAKSERIPASSLPAEFFEEMHLSSRGDLRHAIFAMQFRCLATAGAGGEGGSARKDAKLSTFHALGKLLYAKRKQSQHSIQHQKQSVGEFFDSDDDGFTSSGRPASASNRLSKWEDGRGQLEFVPEEVLSRIDMGLSPAMSFLSYHSIDFFTDVTDLSRSCDLMSDAATFLDRFAGGQTASDGPYPNEYAACLGGRAVADANMHPAPPQFRQFTAPKVFSVMKKSRENEAKIERLRRRLSQVGRGNGRERTSIHDNIGSACQFVTDSLPFMRTAIPDGKCVSS